MFVVSSSFVNVLLGRGSSGGEGAEEWSAEQAAGLRRGGDDGGIGEGEGARRGRSGRKGENDMKSTLAFLQGYLADLHGMAMANTHSTVSELWEAFFQVCKERALPWDQDYLANMKRRRGDNSIFLSIASYR